MAVIGVGNKLMGDEGVGIHAIEALRKTGDTHFSEKFNAALDMIDGGTGGMALLHVLERYEEVILIDCADFSGKPGEARSFGLDNVNLDQDTPQVSLHSTSLSGILAFAKTLGIKVPKITIIAIQPKKIIASTELSRECSDSLPRITDELKRLLASEFKDVL